MSENIKRCIDCAHFLDARIYGPTCHRETKIKPDFIAGGERYDGLGFNAYREREKSGVLELDMSKDPCGPEAKHFKAK